MKKLFAILLALGIILSLAGCSERVNDGGDMTPDISEPSQITDGNDMLSSTTDDKAAISKEEAIDIALKHAGLKEDEVTRLTANLDYEDDLGEPEKQWDVDFYKGNIEYSYDIDAKTGKVIKSEKDLD